MICVAIGDKLPEIRVRTSKASSARIDRVTSDGFLVSVQRNW